MERVVSEFVETEEEINRRHNEKMARRKAARERMLATKTEERGLFIVHTGKGKGKSTEPNHTPRIDQPTRTPQTHTGGNPISTKSDRHHLARTPAATTLTSGRPARQRAALIHESHVCRRVIRWRDRRAG